MNFFDIQLHQKKNMNVVRLIDKDIVSYTMCKQTYIQVADRGKIENEWLYTTKTTTTTKETKLTGQQMRIKMRCVQMNTEHTPG